MHDRLFKDIHVVRLEALAILINDPLKFNNPIKIFKLNPNIIIIFIIIKHYYFLSLNIYEYRKYYQSIIS